MNKKSRPETEQDSIMSDENFFMMLGAPVTVRRNLLEASKSSLYIIKGLLQMNELRPKKLEKLDALRREIREIRLLLQKAEELLPKYSKQEAVKKFPHLAPVKKKEVPKPVPVPAPVVPVKQKKKVVVPQEIQKKLTEAERIAQSMSQIEGKIRSLPPKEAPRPSDPRLDFTAPVASAAKESELSKDPTFDLGKTLEGIQKKLKQL